MTLYPTDRTALFIDGANLYSAARALNTDLDFRKLVESFREKAVLVRAYYYTAVVEGEDFCPAVYSNWLGPQASTRPSLQAKLLAGPDASTYRFSD